MQKLVVNKVAVLGAGVMGAQIAAHFANCQHQVLLFDLPDRATLALKTITKLKPSPIVNNKVLEYITPCDYDKDLELLAECDWIIEAVAEDINIKSDLYNKIKKHINNTAILSSNTSGLSINNLAELLTENNLNQRFCGTHFFNPPRYQKLVELIPHSDLDNSSENNLLNKLEDYLTRYLGKSVVRAKDTPNFIANRIGVFSMLVTMYYAEHFKLGYNVVDILTGGLIGRPKSGTFRTADVVGLDTLAKVMETSVNNCPDDPWIEYLKTPDIISTLISKNHLGQKSQKGFYTKDGKHIKVLDSVTHEYIVSDNSLDLIDSKLLDILKLKSNAQKFTKLKEYKHPQAQFLWSCFREVWLYSVYHLNDIADNISNIDCALKWGFGWSHGPFEIWQDIGWSSLLSSLRDDINNNHTLVKLNLPTWVDNITSAYNNKLESYNPGLEHYQSRSDLKVYNRQITHSINYKNNSHIILENNSAKLWEYKTNSSSNLIFSFKTKMNIINTELLELLSQSIDYIITNNDAYNSLVIWQDTSEHFSAGADLKGFVGCIEAHDYTSMDNILKLFQDTLQKLRYSTIPVVAALKGMAIGGGCELLLHCDHVVASLESYVGLVEVGVGLLPAGGGCKEMVLRANQFYENLIEQKLALNPDKLLQQYFTNIAMAKVSTSAYEARDMGYLKNTDTIIANPEELLYIALYTADNLANNNYRPPVKNNIKTSGNRLKANILSLLANYYKGDFISEHDNLISVKVANVLSGGDLDTDTYAPQEWYLDLERAMFIELLKTEKTQERVKYMLAKGKPLRN